MGEIALAAVVAHQPMIMLPEKLRVSLGGTGADTTLVEPGFRRLRERLAELKVDTLVIIDTHWFTTTEHVIAGADHFRGQYTSEEMPRTICDVPYDYPGAPELAAAWHRVGKQRDLHTINVTVESLPVHYPTINLVHHLRTSERVLSCGVVQTASADEYLAYGDALRQAIEEMDSGRIAILGSGGMSHTFWPLSEIREHFSYKPAHVISNEARDIDARILAHWLRGEHARVLELYPEYRERYHPEGRFAHYLITLGALGGPTCRAPGEQLSNYENAVGTGQVHVAFQPQA
ncbi:MAG: hypothetical protein OXU20_42225 [Myxococcales bacterium]|nr:hypothetical protein [Myxococcales bacterium]MDD9969112.1 hypothetical protein [Myxococcales bacterium]